MTQTVTRYDAAGHPVFTSYPQRTLDAAVYNTWGNPAQTPNALGVRTFYDALDRVTQVEQNSEHGILRTTTAYLPGFQTRVTDPRQNVTTTGYVTYDQPSTDQPAWISHPEGATTSFARDVFGKPLWMERTGTAGEWSGRYYTYDQHQRLCKRSELETRTTNMGYDDAGNLAWSASGLPWSTDSNCALDTAGRRIDRTYDGRNRIKTLRFPGGNGDQDWSYYADGLPSTVLTANYGTVGESRTEATNTYAYNKRRLLTGETTGQGGYYNFAIGYGYDGNGNLASQSYPSGLMVTYNPNALGQATQVMGGPGIPTPYASAVTYYPNGAISGFSYGNGLSHSMVQNDRQLPEWVADQGTLHMRHTYDPNGNVSTVTDYAQAGRRNVTMQYDGLDRLLRATSLMFGGMLTEGYTITYGYDALDNISSVVALGRNQRYCYNANQQLTFVRSNSTSCSDGAAVTSLNYDRQGNVATKNNVEYQFDFGNRLREASSASSTATAERYRYDAYGRRVLANQYMGPTGTVGVIFSQYAQNGQLMYQENQRSAVAKKTDYIYLSGSLVAQREVPTAGGAAVLKFQHTDALGSPVAVTNFNGTAILERMEYEPYGKGLFGGPGTTAPKDGPGYTGHVLDVATGMNYMQQRYYDPGIGRNLSVDPVTAYDNGDMRFFNRYAYAFNNPYKFTDPDGRCPNCVTGGIGAGIGLLIGLGAEGYKQFKAGEFNGRALAVEGGKGALVGGLIGLTGGAAAASGMTLGAQAATTGAVAFGVGTGAHSVGEVAKGNAAPSAGDSMKVGAATALGAVSGTLISPATARLTTSVIPAVSSNPVTSLSGKVFNTVNIPAQTVTRPAAAETLNNAAAAAVEDRAKRVK